MPWVRPHYFSTDQVNTFQMHKLNSSQSQASPGLGSTMAPLEGSSAPAAVMAAPVPLELAASWWAAAVLPPTGEPGDTCRSSNQAALESGLGPGRRVQCVLTLSPSCHPPPGISQLRARQLPFHPHRHRAVLVFCNRMVGGWCGEPNFT